MVRCIDGYTVGSSILLYLIDDARTNKNQEDKLIQQNDILISNFRRVMNFRRRGITQKKAK